MIRTTSDESGFTLVELLVVILVVGILAAIAIPMFVGQRVKALDTDAKSNARNLVSQMETCLHERGNYTGCSAALASSSTGLPIGTGPGQVHVTDESPEGYRIVSTSKADDGGANHVFYVDHTAGSLYAQTCTPAGFGGCSAAGDW